MTLCKIEGCEKPKHGRGWCRPHYLRWYKHGDPDAGGVQRLDRSAAFDAYTRPEGECIVWAGGTDRAGYGKFRSGGKSYRAHRYAWERVHGPIPAGMYIDHTCYNHGCVNPAHLRLATPAQNSSNKSGPHRNRINDLPRGVTPHKYGYQARAGGKHVGVYPTAAEAGKAADDARRALYGEYAGKG